MALCLLNAYFYRPQRSWGKVIFSQASVILLTGGVPAPGLMSGHGGSAPWGVSAPGGIWSRGVSAPWGSAWWRPPGRATAAGGTHPTGMHSCLLNFFVCRNGIFHRDVKPENILVRVSHLNHDGRWVTPAGSPLP